MNKNTDGFITVDTKPSFCAACTISVAEIFARLQTACLPPWARSHNNKRLHNLHNSHNSAQLCTIVHNFSQLCTIVHNCAQFFRLRQRLGPPWCEIFFILCFLGAVEHALMRWVLFIISIACPSINLIYSELVVASSSCSIR